MNKAQIYYYYRLHLHPILRKMGLTYKEVKDGLQDILTHGTVILRRSDYGRFYVSTGNDVIKVLQELGLEVHKELDPKYVKITITSDNPQRIAQALDWIKQFD